MRGPRVWVLGFALTVMCAVPARSGETVDARSADLGQIVGPAAIAGCWFDLTTLDLPEATLKGLQGARLELRKKTIEMQAKLDVLDLDLAEILEDRAFNLTAAQKVVGAISVKESEMRVAHVEYLHELAHALTDPQWEKIQDLCSNKAK